MWLGYGGFIDNFLILCRTQHGEETEPPPPCMPEVFRCLGKASRASLSAMSRHLRLRGEYVFALVEMNTQCEIATGIVQMNFKNLSSLLLSTCQYLYYI